MAVDVILVDLNPHMVRAWREAFEDHPEVRIVHGSLLAQRASAWVSPTNARGSMDGGLDAAIRGHLGGAIQARVKREIAQRFGARLPVGCATAVQTGRHVPGVLVSTPTMAASSENVGDTLNVALACAAALQAVRMHNRERPGAITSVALPGLGAGTGRVPVDVCADLMWTAYNLFLDRDFDDFAAVRTALRAELGECGAAVPARAATGNTAWAS